MPDNGKVEVIGRFVVWIVWCACLEDYQMKLFESVLMSVVSYIFKIISDLKIVSSVASRRQTVQGEKTLGPIGLLVTGNQLWKPYKTALYYLIRSI